MKKLAFKVIIGLGLVVSILLVSQPAVVSAGPFSGSAGQVCGGAALSAGAQPCDSGPASTSITNIVAVAVNILSVVVGIAAVIMIILGGFKFVTSQGDANATASARNTIIYAVVGLIVVALAQFIVKAVLRKTTT